MHLRSLIMMHYDMQFYLFLFIFQLGHLSMFILIFFFCSPQSSESDVHQRGRGLATRGCRPISPTSGNHTFNLKCFFLCAGVLKDELRV